MKTKNISSPRSVPHPLFPRPRLPGTQPPASTAEQLSKRTSFSPTRFLSVSLLPAGEGLSFLAGILGLQGPGPHHC